MSDGANLGVEAVRALRTIIGGEPAPEPEELESREATERRVRSAPMPGDGEPIHQRGLDSDVAYSLAADALAHAFLVLDEEQPGILRKQLTYGDAPEQFDDAERRWWDESMKGKPQEANAAVWEAFCERWPAGNEWIGGASGFQVGFAYNLACYLTGAPPAPNPAIVDIEVPSEPEGDQAA